METNPTQTARIGKLTTPLGDERLVLTRFDGHEGVSELFEFTIEAYSTDAAIDFNPAIGTNCCLSVQSYGGPDRHFNGILVAAKWTGMRDTYYTYRLVLKPWLWLLSRTGNCRIFANKTVPQIIKEVFGKHASFAKFADKLQSSYDPVKYCVQYRESDLNFVCRLMELVGIYFFFSHSEDEHQLVLADSLSSHDPKANGEELLHRLLEGTMRRDKEHVHNWAAGRSFNAGKVVLNDYDFKRPSASLICDSQGGGGYQNDSLEIYDYPGCYKENGLGQSLAKVRLEAEQAADHRVLAQGDALSCVPGYLATLSEHRESSQNKRYLILRAAHAFEADNYRSGGTGPAGEIYSGQYEFLSADVPFRAPPVTPKPVVHGPQTAVVVGDGEIDVDADGCILLQFHWDRDKQNSRRVRVAQIWSGNGWGGIVIPRVGQEAVVQFVEGDPDRPLVIGTVYNGQNKTPYGLPSDKTIAGVKSNSSTGGGGYNEFIFDDKKGSELVRLHGQKDMGSVIENDQSWKIGNDSKKKVGNDEEIEIGNVLKIKAGAKIELTVAQSKIVMDPMGITIQAPNITIKADMKLDATGTLSKLEGTATLTLKGGIVFIN